MSIFDTKFQFYPSNVYVTEALGDISLNQMLAGIKSPKPKIQEVFHKIREATEKGDSELKNNLKKNLFYFTPSVYTDGRGRRYENVLEYNELMVVEFDKVDFALELKETLFHSFKAIVAAFVSPSGKGCKFIVRIPKPKDAEEYKQYYCGLAYHLDKYKGFDVANYNPLLPLYLSWDSDILIRENPKIWTGKGEKINTFDYKADNTSLTKAKDFAPTEKDIQNIKNRICKMFSNITDDGHTKVRGSALILGGYVGAGYLSMFEGESLISDCIDGSPYLRKNLRGYKKTAIKFLSDGARSPIYL